LNRQQVAALMPLTSGTAMTETQERFLRTVLTRVPLESVVEMHLFPPIRRGTLETGVAVIATVLPPAPMLVVDAEDVARVDASSEMADDVEMDEVTVVVESAATVESTEATDATEATDVIDATADIESDVPVADGDDASPYAADIEPLDASAAIPHVEPRLRILTASYRATIKGVERGKWTVDVQEEADAPREAVEAVLRGVRHRSTEPADPELVSHDVLAALIAPVTVAPAA
jgi:hypothetical protein